MAAREISQLLDRTEDPLAALVVCPAQRRQADPLAGTLEKRPPDGVLEYSDELADRGLADTQPRRARGEAASARDLKKVPEMIHFHWGPRHCHSLKLCTT